MVARPSSQTLTSNGSGNGKANGHGHGVPCPDFQSRVRAMFYGIAFGDALGAVVEKLSYHQIKDTYGRVDSLLTPWWRESQDDRKRKGRIRGHGIVTDDTLMTMCVMNVYKTERRHLDAWDVAKGLVREVMWTPRWIPEMQRETMLQERLWYAEKWLFQRHQMASCDPRQGGIGNQVNCGAAMCIAPVGAINACDPKAAYTEAIGFASGHQESYGLEAAGVLAACIATAFIPGATIEDVVKTAIDIAKDGTRSAIVDITTAARGLTDSPYEDVVATFHRIIAKYSPGGDDIDYNYDKAGTPTRAYTPSRFGSIEELPLALGFILTNRGDFSDSITDGINSGRDTDSIGVMIGAILGALQGEDVIKDFNLDILNKANRLDIIATADEFSRVANFIMATDEIYRTSAQQARHAICCSDR